MKISKRNDILVLSFFFVLVAMFATLLFFFFKGEDFQVQTATVPIPDGVLTISVNSKTPIVTIKSSDSNTAYLTYQKVEAQNNELDAVSTSLQDTTFNVKIDRVKYNSISANRPKSAELLIFLPKDSGLSVKINGDVGKIDVDGVTVNSLSVEGKASTMSLVSSDISKLSLTGNSANLSVKSSKIGNVFADLDVCNAHVFDINKMGGFILDADITLGRINNDLGLHIGQWGLFAEYKEKISFGQAATKIELKVNLANITLSG